MHDDQPLIVIVDDDDAICRALSRLLRAQGYRVRTYATPHAFLDESDALSPSCALIDIRMPGIDGLELLRLIRESGIEVPAVFMTATGDIRTIVGAMKEGAIDLLPKPFTAEQLNAAISRAIQSADVADHDRRGLDDIWRTAAGLTPREAEVCGLVACGFPNKRVAALIGTKEKTVKVHRGRVMQKLGMSSFAELVRFVETLHREASHKSLRIDARETQRPRSVNIIIDFVNRERVNLTAVGNRATVDQWTMPAGAQ
ncbi:MAG: response regulator transcription factor [Gemmatimonadaceae bacterium]